MTPTLPTTPGMPNSLSAQMPVGAVIAFAGQIATLPVNPITTTVYATVTENFGWMLCDGSTLSIGEYGQLYNAIGNQYNTGKEASGQFSIPDYRGYFLRMVDLGTNRDPDTATRVLPNGETSSAVGSIQQDALQTHQHSYNNPTSTAFSAGNVTATAVTQMPPTLTGTPTDDLASPPGGVRVTSETRAKNVYVNYLIKFA